MKYFISIILLFITAGLYGQDDLMNLLSQNATSGVNYISATFKSTRIMNGHSIERMPSGQLDTLPDRR